MLIIEPRLPILHLVAPGWITLTQILLNRLGLNKIRSLQTTNYARSHPNSRSGRRNAAIAPFYHPELHQRRETARCENWSGLSDPGERHREISRQSNAHHSMITSCLECGKAISTKQDRCPYCQVLNEQNEILNVKTRKKSWLVKTLAPLFD